MKKTYRIGLFVWGIGFTLFFIFHLIYGFMGYQDGDIQGEYQSASINRDDFEFSKNNYASSKMTIQEAASSQSIDQKYQKIATLKTETGQFNEDERKIRRIVKQNDALIQFEQNTGLPGKRQLDLAIGVPPARFDSTVAVLMKVGKLASLEINKFDKTNEFKELNGQRDSLLKTRAALTALKDKGGKIDEYINLENRILDIDEQLQKLGVSLGDYDANNEFCTVKLSISEVRGAIRISLLQRLKKTLEWTIQYYLLFTVGLIAVLLAILVVLAIIAKCKEIMGTGNDRSVAGK